MKISAAVIALSKIAPSPNDGNKKAPLQGVGREAGLRRGATAGGARPFPQLIANAAPIKRSYIWDLRPDAASSATA
jgi:hypothetical protein